LAGAGPVEQPFTEQPTHEDEHARVAEGDPIELAALKGAAGHEAVDRALAGNVEKEKGLGDPSGLVRLLLLHLRAARRP
jgi:hypothetical protein